jgi:hypothetical protein
MSRPQVVIAQTGGAVTVRVEDVSASPQSLVAVVSQFAATGERERVVGEIRRTRPAVELGTPAAIAGKTFVVDGFVVPFMDDPPTPYRVEVTVLQDGQERHQEVPPDGGEGTIGKTAVRFGYTFDVRTA